MFQIAYGNFSVDKALLADTTATKMAILPQQCFGKQPSLFTHLSAVRRLNTSQSDKVSFVDWSTIREGNWAELTFAKTSGIITRKREKKLANS